MKLLDAIRKVVTFVAFVVCIILVYQLTKKILGGSWSVENLVLALVSANVAFIVGLIVVYARLQERFGFLQYRVDRIEKNMDDMKTGFEARFNKIETQLGKIEANLKDISRDLHELKQGVKGIKRPAVG